MGIGYAAWNDGTKINVSMKTGFIKPVFLLEGVEKFDNGQLVYSLSTDRRTLNITGNVYPSFDEDIPIKIIDEGSIPSVYTDLEIISEDEISVLNEYSGKQRKSLNINDDYIEHFELNINPDSDYKEARRFNEALFDTGDEISNLEEAIENLKKEIELYDTEIPYTLNYILNFEQGL